MSDVWALNLLPVVRERKTGKPGNDDTWSDEQLELLVKLRADAHGRVLMQWSGIARILNRPLKSCHRRYAAIMAARKPKEDPAPRSLSAAAPRRRSRLHEELGIGTYTVVKRCLISCPRGDIFVDVEKVICVTLSSGFAK